MVLMKLTSNVLPLRLRHLEDGFVFVQLMVSKMSLVSNDGSFPAD